MVDSENNFLTQSEAVAPLSVQDFLIHDLQSLVADAEQQPSSERFMQAINQVLSVIDGLHQPWLNGVDLMEDAQKISMYFLPDAKGWTFYLEADFAGGNWKMELKTPSASLFLT
ncbi:DNA repair protein RAD51 homolog 4 isoform X3 [Eucalyptus grandis]|uniref:Uncharacterized protein n=2 Tax=Eucalyptus grandis TaxID=71139 RepID=A0ACC3IUR7_EUCGR|nr:DNA repair protein RAD51 homolog 4 isoform X3 [Eucalyptus grandis]KAK3405642.1 hypothetical protein EUGRSUZ_K01871 [Eucalyptus grandis]